MSETKMKFHFYVVEANDISHSTKEYTDLDEAIARFKKELEEGKEYASLEFLRTSE